MPTVIALDVSLSMTSSINGHSDDELSKHQLAVQGINEFLDHLASNSKLEFVSLVLYSNTFEVLVDFTRDYEFIKHALKKIVHQDKTNLLNMLQCVSNILASVWGTQSYCQVLVFTDCGIGFYNTSLQKVIANLSMKKNESDYAYLTFLKQSKINFMCIGTLKDSYFKQASQLYQKFLDVIEQNGNLYLPSCGKEPRSNISDENNGNINNTTITNMVQKMCESNYKEFVATLKCGGYFKLECGISIWPPPMPYKIKDHFGREIFKYISSPLEVCGFLGISDIGSPVSVSRHLIVPKTYKDKAAQATKSDLISEEHKKLENDIKSFYAKSESNHSDEDEGRCLLQSECNKESVCVLLHGALKVENMAALVLLNDNWFGFIYSYADSKKKSNLMLNILPPGRNVVPWLGDLRFLGTADCALPGENPNFPVKSEKRSYSQNCVVWIKHAGLQSDIQKVLRHSKKLPEKTPHFYKELNRIRRAALSFGFIELLEGLANIFDRELTVLPQNASPDCVIQLKHAASELRKITNRDLKTLIAAQPTKYNQL